MDKFWKSKSLEEMNNEEWESLCDGCGKCCLEKIEDIETGIVYTTKITCRLLNTNTCKCTQYKKRFSYMNDCIKLTPKKINKIKWLPKTCSYRLVLEKKDLPIWHPLNTKDKQSTIKSGNSVKSFGIHPALSNKNFCEYIIDEDI